MSAPKSLREWLDVYTAQGDAALRCAWVKRAWRVMRPLVEGYVMMVDLEGESHPQTLINAIDAAAREQRVGGKRWEQERGVLIKALESEIWPEATADDRGVVAVASDLVEMERYVEAIELMGQAIGALSRKCPACASPRGIRCTEIGGKRPEAEAAALRAFDPKCWPGSRIVPHESRVTP